MIHLIAAPGPTLNQFSQTLINSIIELAEIMWYYICQLLPLQVSSLAKGLQLRIQFHSSDLEGLRTRAKTSSWEIYYRKSKGKSGHWPSLFSWCKSRSADDTLDCKPSMKNMCPTSPLQNVCLETWPCGLRISRTALLLPLHISLQILCDTSAGLPFGIQMFLIVLENVLTFFTSKVLLHKGQQDILRLSWKIYGRHIRRSPSRMSEEFSVLLSCLPSRQMNTT